MIKELLSRPNIQEFLNKYPSNRWKELLADLFEIGVLNLKNSYHREEFSKNEFSGIKYDLEYSNQKPPEPKIQLSNNYKYQNSNFSYPKNYSNFSSPQYLKDNKTSYKNNFDYGRRTKRLSYLNYRATPQLMDAFYSEKNDISKKNINKKKKRSHYEIMDKIYSSQQKREDDRELIRRLKVKYIKNRNKEKERKRKEKMMERQAEEDIKEEENERIRQKEEEDYREGYGEDYQEEDEQEEEEGTDKYNDYNRGYDDEEEEEEGEEVEEEVGEEEVGEEEVGEEEVGEEEIGEEQDQPNEGEEYGGEEEGYQGEEQSN